MKFLKGMAYYAEKDATYYDGNAHVTSCNASNFMDSPYALLHELTVNLIKKYQCSKILEIGCGNGVFAQRLFNSGCFRYSGFDFSEKRLEIARKRVPEYKIFKDDIYTSQAYFQEDYDVVVCHEVLEHLKNDFHPLKNIKLETRVLFSVPTYDSDAHVRFFSSSEGVFARYAKYVKISGIFEVNRIFLVDGVSIWGNKE